jgi:threonine dehydratase
MNVYGSPLGAFGFSAMPATKRSAGSARCDHAWQASTNRRRSDNARMVTAAEHVPALDVDTHQIERAANHIDRVFLNSPQFLSEALSAFVGMRTIVKVETVNPIGCFKGRGGDWLAQTARPGEVLVCASAGNLGQGLAFGARTRGIDCHVFASAQANPIKLQRIKNLGATLHQVAGDFDTAKTAAARAATERGWRLIEDGNEPALAVGAGTIGVEITQGLSETIDTVILPVGNGSLACGVGTWFKTHSPKTRVIGVSAQTAPATHRAWAINDYAPGAPFDTCAEGLASRVSVPAAVKCLQNVLDDFILATENELLMAVNTVWHLTGLTAEPSGSASIVAACRLAKSLAGTTTVLLISGSNVDPQIFLRAVTSKL